MISLPPDLQGRLISHGQEHILAWWSHLDEASRGDLLDQLKSLDLDQLTRLYRQREKTETPVPLDKIKPVPVIPGDSPHRHERKRLGEEAFRRGEIAALVVAGGQGSRLGFEHPKGMYPIGPLSGKSLFHIHAAKVAALGRRYGRPVPFLVMTSPATHEETLEYFHQENYLGLSKKDVYFFCQDTMPSLDLATGKLLFEAPGRLFLSPDGHGGTLTALAKRGVLSAMQERGVRHLSYFQVDNPLVRIGDPVFLGHHLHARAEVSSKVIAKRDYKEKMGVFTQIDGRCTIVEYSDLPESLARETDEHGRLRLWAGSPAIHLFEVAFLERMTRDPDRLPFHLARKKVPCLDASGKLIQPARENALKFERFIFDVLPAAERWTVVEGQREEDFAPLKNPSGEDSAQTCQQAIMDQARRWLHAAMARLEPGLRLEVSPLFALDAEELAQKIPAGSHISTDRYFD